MGFWFLHQHRSLFKPSTNWRIKKLHKILSIQINKVRIIWFRKKIKKEKLVEVDNADEGIGNTNTQNYPRNEFVELWFLLNLMLLFELLINFEWFVWTFGQAENRRAALFADFFS